MALGISGDPGARVVGGIPMMVVVIAMMVMMAVIMIVAMIVVMMTMAVVVRIVRHVLLRSRAIHHLEPPQVNAHRRS
jgi:hypothetical protein